MGQILIDFFGHSLYPLGYKTVEKLFLIIFLGVRWYIDPSILSLMNVII